MKTLRPLILAAVILTAFSSQAQVEQGDFNIGASLSLNTTTGQETNSGSWNLLTTAGYYFTDNLEAGAILLISGTIADESTTNPGYGAFASYSFLTDGQFVPFVGAQLFALTIQDFDTFVSVGINAGAKYFLKENIFINNRLDWGTTVSPSEAEGGNLNLTIGLGFIL